MKKDTSIIVREEGGSLTTARKILNSAFAELAAPFSGKMAKPAVMGEAYAQLVEVSKVVSDTIEIAKAKMKELVERKGEVTTEKGSMERQLGSYLYSMRPTRTGTDPKKLEARLRAKGVKDLQEYMDAVVTYKVSEQKLRQAIEDGHLSTDELDSVSYDKTYALQPPKKVEE